MSVQGEREAEWFRVAVHVASAAPERRVIVGMLRLLSWQ